MRDFRTLLMMQLKEKLDISFLKSAKQTLLKILFFLLEFAVICAVAYVILWLCQFLNLFSPLAHLPLSVMAVVFCVMFVFSLITCTMALSKSLFQSSDNALLFSFPVTSSAVFFSKLAAGGLNELKRTFLFLIPIFIAYAILCNLQWYAYIWIIVMLAIFTVFLVLLAGLLAIPINYIVRFFNRFFAARLAGVLVILALVVWLLVWLIGLIPADVSLIKNWVSISTALREGLSWFTTHMYVFYAFALFLCGMYSDFHVTFFTTYSWAVLLVMLGAIIVLWGLNFLISHFLYLKVAIRQGGSASSRHGKEKRNRRRKGFWAACVYETEKSVKSSGVLSASIISIIVIPFVIVLMNTIYSAISTRLLGQDMILAFNVLIVLLLATSSNVWVSSIYSRDGEALPLCSTMPQKPFPMLMSRLMYSFVMTLVMIIPSSAVFLTMAGVGAVDSTLLILFELLVAFGHILWSAETDFTNPRPDIYKASGAAGINGNELKSIILSFAVSLIAAVIVIFFLMDIASGTYVRILLFGVMFAAYKFITFWFKARTMYGVEKA